MAELTLTVSSERAPLSTQFWEFCKGVEHFYYALAFTGDGRGRDPDTWRSWAQQGFHLAIKSPPPGTPPNDTLRLDMQLRGKAFKLIAHAPDANALQRLAALLQHIDTLRPSLQQLPPQQRVDRLLADSRVRAELIEPLEQAIAAAELYPDDAERFDRAFERGLAALTDEELVSVEQSTLSPAAS
jgi:hypothetical protein